jgi:hypothetical protein
MQLVRSLVLLLIGVLLGFAVFWLQHSRSNDAPSLIISRETYTVTPFQGYDSKIFPLVQSEVEMRFKELVGSDVSKHHYIATLPGSAGFDLVVCSPEGAPSLDEAKRKELFEFAHARLNHYDERFRPSWHTRGLE